jgi:hypothetical protein
LLDGIDEEKMVLIRLRRAKATKISGTLLGEEKMIRFREGRAFEND